MKRIRTNLLHRRNRQISIFSIKISFDNNCVSNEHFTEEQYKKLLAIDRSFSLVEEPKIEEIVDEIKNIELDNKEIVVYDDKLQENDYFKSLSLLTVKELQSIAKEANLPNQDWFNLKKEQLINYLVLNTKQ